jgi:predicted O-linked N-acetylglucosamine transferase (SPINDLY family)
MSHTASTPKAKSLTVEEALHQAVSAHRAGQLQNAEYLYRAILQSQPKHPQANHNLGILAGQMGHIPTGLPYLKTALIFDPKQGQYAISFAEALLATGQHKIAQSVIHEAIQRGFNTPAAHNVHAKTVAAGKVKTNPNESPTTADVTQLNGLYQSGRPHDLEIRSRALIEKCPDSGFAWKMFGLSLQAQGKDGLAALWYATELLPDDAEAHFNLANEQKARGQLKEAVASYQQSLRVNPDDADAHSNLGNALMDQGNIDAAAASYQCALEIKPDYFEAHYNLGNALMWLGRFDAALASYLRAVELSPNDADAHYNAGNAYQRLKKLEEAIASYQRAVSIRPGFGEAFSNLGNTFASSGSLDSAIASFQRALAIDPTSIGALVNLGNALLSSGKVDDAAVCFQKALDIDKDNVGVLNNLGNALQALGRIIEAESSFRRALTLDPNFAEAFGNLGNLLHGKGLFEDAASCHRKAIALKPEFAGAYNNLGHALQRLGQFEEAAVNCRKALEINPHFPAALCNLGNALHSMGNVTGAAASYHEALKTDPDFVGAYSTLLFLQNSAQNLPLQQLSQARGYGDLVARQARPYSNWDTPPLANRPLRVGWVSGDLRNHPVGYFAEGLLAAFASTASDRIELFAYFNDYSSDELTNRIKPYFHGWQQVSGISDEHLAKQIHDDAIDILIDLSGHTAQNRLAMFAWKPAPVQVTWLGYLGTTGVSAIDYLIADPWTLPGDSETEFTEKIWRLPETYICLTPPANSPTVSDLPARKNGFVTFGSFNNLTKLTDDVIAVWAQLLNSVSRSRLLLKADKLDNPSVQQGISDRFARHNVASEQLVFEGRVESRDEHLATYRRIDIALDPFPYPGITTTLESLWMGVPVLTLAGDRFISRQGVGLLTNAGLQEWVATDTNDYISRAILHAGDLPRLSAIRRTLRKQVKESPLFNAQRFAGHFEAALRGMWVRWCETQ